MSASQSTAHGAESNAMSAWIAKWPAGSFYLFTLMLSWGYWLTLLAQGRRVEPGSVVTLLLMLFAVALFHATLDLSWMLFPVYGSHFDMRLGGLIMAAVAVMVTVVCGPQTLVRYKND